MSKSTKPRPASKPRKPSQPNLDLPFVRPLSAPKRGVSEEDLGAGPCCTDQATPRSI